MRAWPPLQAVLVLAALGLLAIPLVRLTGDTPAPPAPAEATGERKGADPVPGWLAVRFAHPPLRARLLAGGRVLWDGAETGEAEVELPIEDGYLELAVEIRWPDGTPRTAAEIEVTPDGYESRKRTLWGEGETSEILNFRFGQ